MSRDNVIPCHLIESCDGGGLGSGRGQSLGAAVRGVWGQDGQGGSKVGGPQWGYGVRGSRVGGVPQDNSDDTYMMPSRLTAASDSKTSHSVL